MTIPTRYVRTAERWSVGRMLSLLAEIGRGALNVAQARQTHGLTTAELDAWITAFAAYGAGGPRANHRNIVARRIRRLRKRGHVHRWHRPFSATRQFTIP